MQETRYYDENKIEQSFIEIFHSHDNDREKLLAKMNNRLFELEVQGHELVQQRPVSLSEKIALERSKKAKKKLNRMNKEIA